MIEEGRQVEVSSSKDQRFIYLC